MVLQLTVFWYIGAVLGHVCLGLGVLALVTMLLSWVFFFPQWGLGVCVVLWSAGCKSIQFLVHSFIHHQVFISVKDQALEVTTRGLDPYSPTRDEKGKNTHADK